MKLTNKLLFLSLSLFLIVSCSEDDDLNLTDVSGIYEGTLSSNVSSKLSGKTIDDIGNLATAEVSEINGKIQVYIYNETFEATKMLDMFTDDEDVKVCATGSDFEMMYGKKSDGGMNGGSSGGMNGGSSGGMNGGSSGGMNGGSSGGMNGGSSSGMNGKSMMKWGQHLSTDHKQSDKHSGGFDMDSESFEFTFILDGVEITFKGKKQL